MSKISWSLRRRCTICTYSTHTANLQTTNTNHIYSYIAVQLHTTRISHLSRNYRVIYIKMSKYNIGVCTDLLHIHREPPILHFYVYTIYYAYCCTQSQQQHDILLYNLLLEKKSVFNSICKFWCWDMEPHRSKANSQYFMHLIQFATTYIFCIPLWVCLDFPLSRHYKTFDAATL